VVLERSIPLTDYYSILSRAVGTLGPNTAQTRSALFGRARQMLVDQINHEPQFWSEAAAEAELGRFDAATDRIEAGWASRLAIEPRDEIPRYRPEYPDPDATHPYRNNPPKFTIGRVAILGAVGLSALLGIGIGVYSLRGGSETAANKPAQTRTPPATRTASRPALGGDELDPGVDGGSTDTMLPYHMRRQAVYYRSVYSEGMLLVDRSQRFLYLIQPQSRAVRYGIGVGGECDVSAGLSAYTALNAAVLGISGDSPFAQEQWAQKEKIQLPLLSDYEHKVAAAYGCAYDSFLPAKNLPMGGVPKRSAFVVDKGGVIRYAEIKESPGDLPNFDAIKAALAPLK